MPGKRSTIPLFDLLQQGRARGVEMRVPEPEAEHPRPQPVEAVEAAPVRHQSRFSDSPIRIGGGLVQMPIGYGAVALVVALAAVLGAWTLGYRRGESHAKSNQALLESVMGPSGTITEPDGGGSGDEASPRIPNNEQVERRSEPGVGPGRFLTSGGETGTDPRRPKHNYLYLAAKLETAAVQSAMAALQARGIESFAEIDPSTVRRKDGPLYSLIAGMGVPSGETGSQDARRYREQVLAAGAAWKKSGGIWDFADAYWKLYDPKPGG